VQKLVKVGLFYVFKHLVATREFRQVHFQHAQFSDQVFKKEKSEKSVVYVTASKVIS